MKKNILSLILVLVSFNAAADVKADSFDDTGLINTTSDATALASCAKIASMTGGAAIAVRGDFIVQRPTTATEISEKENTISLLNLLVNVKSTNFYNIFQQLPRNEQVAAAPEFSATIFRVNNAHNNYLTLKAYHNCTDMFHTY